MLPGDFDFIAQVRQLFAVSGADSILVKMEILRAQIQNEDPLSPDDVFMYRDLEGKLHLMNSFFVIYGYLELICLIINSADIARRANPHQEIWITL